MVQIDPNIDGERPGDGRSLSNGVWHWGSFFAAIAVSVVSAGVLQLVVAVRWTGAQDEKNITFEKQIAGNTNRLDQIDVSGTRNIPVLLERLNGLERADTLTRDMINNHAANDVSRFDAMSKRFDTVFDKHNILDRELISIANRLTKLEAEVKALRDISDSRVPFMQRADTALQEQAALKIAVEALRNDLKRADERIDRVVQALDSTYNSLQEHLRNHPTGKSGSK